jgi:hypothetical protein
MKTIEPVNVWVNGQTKQATLLDAYAVNVTFNLSAKFLYTLIVEGEGAVVTGNLTMEGADYQSWDQDSFAWDWIAEQLNIVITGDWVPPVTGQ